MKDKNSNQEIVKTMISHFNNHRLKLPGKIIFRQESENCYTMLLDAENIQKRNMQKVDNSFEGWAVVVYVAMNSSIKIILDVLGELMRDK